MANRLPQQVREKIICIVYRKADEFAYMECDRVKNGQFMDILVEDPDVGGVLRQYMQKERIRTYIKDTILNRYTKDATSKTLSSKTPEQTIQEEYGEDANVIQRIKGTAYDCHVLRSEAGNIYIVSEGTFLKWETALRKGLEVIANEPNLTIDEKVPSLCLKLSLAGQSLTDADKKTNQNSFGCCRGKSHILWFIRRGYVSKRARPQGDPQDHVCDSLKGY